ncbi:membrane fusion protein, multidrug efflux system [Paraburkholderia caballeronis]|uniref:Membrane fusion protein, multidrug efflux system n=2 Tax=Paraburkholderia caballeronis TaxID=416943 RepID=A0A1H7TR20_9BURK|nr:multidrug efflux system membrane fusion protein [Paraburkholderia caballeronis]PXW95344.1 multidrug efflux system membrane fusion protein [Paraburkholderia caballeronis]RAJ91158.1 multidrug efflux system membrane fusion protein [Paraburkholderia caballeronis]SEE15027.1 membrane fusion protein, multidrug efflux system [Paraburkholderia caballeronis]SEL86995.1 membrane fusion protein, multidrug efflux system [Paraburkholderia caballeronis]
MSAGNGDAMATRNTGLARYGKYFAILLVAATLLVLVFVIRLLDAAPRTDDAYVYADTIDVVPEVSGRIAELAVRDNQAVRRGDLLLQIDPRPYEAALTRAKASLVALDRQIGLTRRTVDAQQYNAQSVRAAVERARAAATQATDTLHRTAPLLSGGYVSAQDVDVARTAQRATQAELAAAELQAQQAAAAVSGVDALVAQRAVVEAEIAIAALNLEFATVRAPFDGRVVSLKTSAGQFASALKPVFTLIDTRQWYVVANFRETELKGIAAGTPATVYLLSDSGRRFRGTVDSISYGVLPNEGGLALPGGLPHIERTLNWVHVAQRFPVKIRIEQPDPVLFRVGTSAVAVLHPARGDDAGRR